MLKQTPNTPFDRSALSARQQRAEVSQDLGIRRQMLIREHVILPCPVKPRERPKALSRRMRRMLQQSWKQSLTGLALLLALGQAPAMAGTIFVGGPCTLADAVASANQDLALGGCTPGSGGDSIMLPVASIQTVRTVRPSGLIIRTPITIVGNGSTIRRIGDDDDDSRVFTVTASSLTLQSVAVSGSDDDDLDGDDDGLGDDSLGDDSGLGVDDDNGPGDDNGSGDDDAPGDDD